LRQIDDYPRHGGQKAGGTLLAIDHHRGSEENQPGEEYFDPELDDGEGGMSSLDCSFAPICAVRD
jgi:hypothetical protein